MRNQHPSSCSYTFADYDRGFEIACLVEGRIVPYKRGDYYHPPEGGYVEDAEIKVEDFYLLLNGAKVSVPLNDELRSELTKYVHNVYDNSDVVQNEVYEKMAG